MRCGFFTNENRIRAAIETVAITVRIYRQEGGRPGLVYTSGYRCPAGKPEDM